jgi:hypothetical protein
LDGITWPMFEGSIAPGARSFSNLPDVALAGAVNGPGVRSVERSIASRADLRDHAAAASIVGQLFPASVMDLVTSFTEGL